MNLTLPSLSRSEAKERGYVAITTVFAPAEEPHVARSMESNMKGIDAVWITETHGHRTVAELGRRTSEVNLLSDPERERNNWTQPDGHNPHRN